jgi:hypothetical protein
VIRCVSAWAVSEIGEALAGDCVAASAGVPTTSLDYSRDSGIDTASIRVKGLLNWEND